MLPLPERFGLTKARPLKLSGYVKHTHAIFLCVSAVSGPLAANFAMRADPRAGTERALIDGQVSLHLLSLISTLLCQYSHQTQEE